MYKVRINLRKVVKSGVASLTGKRSLRSMAVIACLAVFTVFSGCFKDDDPNNSFLGKGGSKENVIQVTVGFSTSYSIQSSGEHWFKFVGTGEPVIFETRGNVVSTFINVYEGDANYDLYGTGSGGEGSNALSTRNTTSGTTYFIKVTPQSGTSGTYTFAVTAPTFNIRSNPITVAVGNSSSHIISSGGQHWFKFVGDGNRVFFETGGNVVKTNISIYVEENNNHSWNSQDRVNFITVSGRTYFLCITGNSGTYTFNLRHGTGDGSSKYYAKEVAKGYRSSHTISYGGECWFIYQGTGEPATFKTEGNVVSTYINVYEGDANYDLYGTGSGGEGANALSTRNTTLGITYFIKVTPQSGTSGEYTFVVE